MEPHVEAASPDQGAEQPSYPMGEALRSARLRMGWSVEAAAAELRLSARVLHHIEAGIRVPTGELLDTITELYGIDADELDTRLAAPHVPPSYDTESQTLWLGWMPVIIGDNADNDTILSCISSALRTMRKVADHQPVYIRDREIPILADLMDLDDEDLPFLTMSHLGYTWVEATTLVGELCASVGKVPVSALAR